MNQQAEQGYFTEEQLDRANLKTMANQLPEGYDGSMLLAGLANLAIEHEMAGCSSTEAKQKTIDWYCSTPVEGVTKWLDGLMEDNNFLAQLKLIEMMHEAPEEFERFLELVESGEISLDQD